LKILHTSDWHVGKVLKGRDRHDEHAAVLGSIVQTARDEDVDVVLIAGDLFETAAPNAKAQGLVMRTLLSLREDGRQVVAIAGNHDNQNLLDAVYRPVLGQLGLGRTPQAWCYHARMETQGRTTFGKALRAAITAAGFTQAGLARELHIDAGQVSRWVNGKAIPHRETTARIERILGTDLSAEFAASSPEYELYVAAPITGLKVEDVGRHNAAVNEVVKSAGVHVNSLYWPGEKVRSTSDLTAPDIATERNMRVLQRSAALLYLQFVEIVRPSSALIELGCALGWRLKTTVIIQENLNQPFMLENFGGVAASLAFLPNARIYRVKSVSDACDLITKNGRELLGL